jgi:hypothetical protein
MFLVKKSNARVKFERRTKTLIESSKAKQISFHECTRELDAAFEGFPALNKDELPVVRALAVDNNNAVMQEMGKAPNPLDAREKTSGIRASVGRASGTRSLKGLAPARTTPD